MFYIYRKLSGETQPKGIFVTTDMFFFTLKRKLATLGSFEIWGDFPRFGKGSGTFKKICCKCMILGPSGEILGDLGTFLMQNHSV